MHLKAVSAFSIISATAMLVAALLGCRSTDGTSERFPTVAGTQQHSDLVGAWQLIRQERRNTLSGEALSAETPPGILVYSPDGWMSVTIDRRPTGGSYWGYFGTFQIEGSQLVHNIVGGVPTSRGRSPANFRLENGGRRLVISTLPSAEGVVVDYTWERAAPPAWPVTP